MFGGQKNLTDLNVVQIKKMAEKVKAELKKTAYQKTTTELGFN
jgi:hypothetical protein